ncbi:ATP-binding cassette domain-containing protein [Xylocopilactobacillus apis]|uniref:ABC transporter domain-containing protein n=1 Tax=Xylocopilactobacillus apis TaxID=2932183 RepID=A0AAU9CNX4_9LACO|nr:ATP-binding cassette domain-containing protein [Xylocopilactobacillus apis]BDR55657.1 hypothetical protein KIMC2_02190 [Xylocopilactobacillus apis]
MRIILIDASFSYGQQEIISNFNLQIKENGIYTIVGSTGCGKTTLLKGLSGMIPTSSGVTLIGNFRPNWDVYQNLVSFWNSSKYFYPWMTGFEHLKLLAKSQKTSIQEVFDTSNALKMINYIDRPVKTYPKGIQTRFDLALSSVDDKPLILLDEPFSDIDEDSKIISQNFLKNLAVKKTIIITAKDKKDIMDSAKVISL